MQRILFYGDSLTAGYGLHDPSRESVPGLIQQKINEEKLSFETVNAGLSGDTSGGGLARIHYWINGRIDIFVLELGINDVMRGIPPSQTLKNLQRIIDEVSAKYPDCKIVLMGMEVPDIFAGTRVNEFRGIFRKLADSNSLTFVPFYLKDVVGKSEFNLMDGLHPNAKGYRIIADNIWPALKPLLIEKSRNAQ